jgi:hypothetical protein
MSVPARILAIAESFYDQTLGTAGAYTMEPGPDEPQAAIRREMRERVIQEGETLLAYLRGEAAADADPAFKIDREAIASAIQAGRYGGRMFPATNPRDFADADRIVALLEPQLVERLAVQQQADPSEPVARPTATEAPGTAAAMRTIVAAASVCLAYVNGDNLIEVENRYRECTKILLRAATEPHIARWLLNTEAHMKWVRTIQIDGSDLVAALEKVAEEA